MGKALVRCHLSLLVLLTGSVLAGCGESPSQEPHRPEPPQLNVVNRTEFTIYELYLHEDAAGYRDTFNYLSTSELEPGESMQIKAVHPADTQYITVVRRKLPTSETRVAITSDAPLPLQTHARTQLAYELWILFVSFRLYDPVETDACHFCDDFDKLGGGDDDGAGDADSATD